MGDTEHFCHTSTEILTFSNLEAPNHREYNILRRRGSWAPPGHPPGPLFKKCTISFMKLSQNRHFLARFSPTPFWRV